MLSIKINIMLIFLLFLFLLSCCNSTPKKNNVNNINPENFQPDKLSVDDKISHRELKLVEIIPIEENDSLVLNNITSSIINPNGTKLFIADPSNMSINLYDFKTGKIINSVKAGFDLSIKLGNMGLSPINTMGKKLRYLKSLDDYRNHGITQAGIDMVKNSFFMMQYQSNTILVNCLIHLDASSDEEMYNSIDNRTVLMEYDSNFNQIKWINLETFDDSYPVPTNFIVMKNDDIISSTSNYPYFQKKPKIIVADSIPILARYDKEGKFLGNVFHIPLEYTRHNLMYNACPTQYITQIDTSLFIAFPWDYRVYSLNQKFHFKLKNLPYSNDSVIEFLHNYFEKKNSENGIVNYQEIDSIIREKIVYTFNANGNYCVISLVYDESIESGFYYIIQEYNVQGDLLTQSRLEFDKSNRIKSFVYDSKNGYLCMIKKSKIGWTIEKRKW